MKSYLAFTYSDKTSIIFQSLERIKERKLFEHDDMKINEEIKYKQNIEIIWSDKSCVEKSTIIKKIEKSGKKYIHFPLKENSIEKML